MRNLYQDSLQKIGIGAGFLARAVIFIWQEKAWRSERKASWQSYLCEQGMGPDPNTSKPKWPLTKHTTSVTNCAVPIYPLLFTYANRQPTAFVLGPELALGDSPSNSPLRSVYPGNSTWMGVAGEGEG